MLDPISVLNPEGEFNLMVHPTIYALITDEAGSLRACLSDKVKQSTENSDQSQLQNNKLMSDSKALLNAFTEATKENNQA